MAIVLEGADLVAICGCIVLLGMALATAYTFQKFADALNVSIVGTHPFGFLSRAIEGTIVHWAAVGAKSLEHAINFLWNGLTWSIQETLKAIIAIPRELGNAINYVADHLILDKIRAALVPINKAVNAAVAKVDAFGRELSGDVVRLDAKIDTLGRSVESTITTKVNAGVKQVESAVTADIHKLETTIATDIRQAISTAEGAGTAALDKLKAAEDAAIGALRKTEDATAAQLRDLINSTPLDKLEGLLVAVPALAAAVAVLEAETGLGRAECRGKIKNICATDPSQWEGLLAGIATIGFLLDPKEWIEAIVRFGELSVDAIEELVR